MAKIHLFQRIIAASFACFMVLGAPPAHAGWPSWEDVLEKISPLLGLDNDQREATIFAIKHPVCASTIVAYTLEQDYSLVGFIGALKVTKLQSIPKLLPINGGNCKSYQPIQQAYQFIDRKGDEYLGKSKADFLRNLLADQISEGKSAVDSEISAIPYLGPILTNWDCECDAAFDSNFPSEKLVDQIVGTTISILKSIKDGNYGAALETMITTMGPKVACKLAEEYSGIGSIPIVSDVAAAACESVAGKVVGFVVSAGGALAEGLGLIGGDHIPFEQYYAQMFVPELGKDGYKDLANTLYQKCYDYFEPTNLSASNSKKVCAILRDRYIVQSMGKLQWAEFQVERGDYYKKNVKPKAEGAALIGDAEFKKVKEEVRATCKQYFVQRYPQANIFAAAFNDVPIETVCDDFVSYSPSSYHPWDMDKARNTIQKNLTYAMTGKTGGLCSTDSAMRNLIKCQDGQGLDVCTKAYPKACVSSTLELGGNEIPCCKGGEKPSQGEQMAMEFAAKVAKESGGPFCTTTPNDPLKVVCTLKQTYEACQNHFSWMNQRVCDPKAVDDLGRATTVCCSFNPDGLDSVEGVAVVKKFVETHGGEPAQACSVGGYSVDNLLTYDPRIISCGSEANRTTCKNTFGQEKCKIGAGGLVEKPCCVAAVFGGGSAYVDTYDPSQRTPEELAAAKKLVDDSNGNCTFGTAFDGKPDLFRVVCKTPAALKACVKAAGKGTDARAKCHLTKSGYVQSPCCAPDTSLYYSDYSKIKEQERKLIEKGIGKNGATKAKDIKPWVGGMSKNGLDTDPLDTKKNKREGEAHADDLTKAAAKGNLKDKLGNGKNLDNALNAAKPKRAGGDKRAVGDKDNVLVDIRLMKVKPLSGVSPFTIGDVKNKIDPAANENADAGNGKPAPKGLGNDGIAPTAPAAPIAPRSLRSTSGPASGGSAPFCSGKADGNYCSDANTLTTCYHDAAMNVAPCPSGCDAAARACNPYKP
ncbi:MAG: hypothetical protein SFW65_07885 [Alphaproteobacteria bacterium]|nr:hypothetical protein [Alphaproteobacteria bacterium]